MKTYKEFVVESFVILERGETQVQRKPGESMSDYAQRVRAARESRRSSSGQDAAARERESMKYRDASGRSTNTSGQGNFNKQGQSRTPPRSPRRSGGFKMPNVKVPQGVKQVAGKAAGSALTAYDIYAGTKEKQSKGERLRTALPKSAAEVGGGWASSVAASTAASRVLPKNPWINIPGSIAAGIAGYYGGKSGTSGIINRFEDPFGNKGKFNRIRQSRAVQSSRQQASKANVYGATKGSGIVGSGGKTKIDTKTNTITTGNRTAQLPRTMILPGGRVGDLAYKGGKPTYLARASVASRDTEGSSGIGAYGLRQLSRATGIGGQRERDIAATNRERQQAMQNALRYRQQLGITGTGVSKPLKK